MARRTLSNEVKQGILDGLKNGLRPADLAVTYSVSVPTIYNYKKSQLNVVAAEASAVVASGFDGNGATVADVATLAPVTRKASKKSR